MRLNTSKDVYEFDFKFYLISAAIIFVVGGGFYTAKRMMNYYEGRDVQRLLTKANFGTKEAHRPTARTWAANYKRQYTLDADQTKLAEEIMIDALYNRLNVWIEGRKSSRKTEDIDRDMAAVLNAAAARIADLKKP